MVDIVIYKKILNFFTWGVIICVFFSGNIVSFFLSKVILIGVVSVFEMLEVISGSL